MCLTLSMKVALLTSDVQMCIYSGEIYVSGGLLDYKDGDITNLNTILNV